MPPSGIQTPTLNWSSDTPEDLAAITCPNCGSWKCKRLVLDIDLHLPGDQNRHLRLLHCPACFCRFYDDQRSADYGELNVTDRGRIPFYVQQGAGLSLIIRPLTQVRWTGPCAYMEVGCGYGFGLDYAVNTRGWQGIGVDPGPLAREGRAALGLPIELRYLCERGEAPGSLDVITGAEVIEHVGSPLAFLRTLRRMLRPGGVLILTTPNGDDIGPETSRGVIVPLLSPTTHLIIQNPASLSWLLRNAGFRYVQTDIDGHSVVAFASNSPLDLEVDPARLRQEFRKHLQRRAEASEETSDSLLGFAGRAFQEAVNDGDMAAADQAWALLQPCCQARFDIDLDEIDALPAAVANCELEEMGRLVPLNLAGLLYASGIRRLFAGAARPELEGRFALAAETAVAMRRALGQLAMEDGQTEDIGWTAQAEALLCAAERAAPALAARVVTLPPAPNGGEARRRWFVQRILTTLVMQGHYRLASDVVKAAGLHLEHFAEPNVQPRTDAERDALYSLAVLALNLPDEPGFLGGPSIARQRFIRVRDHLRPEDGLWAASSTRRGRCCGCTSDLSLVTRNFSGRQVLERFQAD